MRMQPSTDDRVSGVLPTPLGELRISATDRGIVSVEFERSGLQESPRSRPISSLEEELHALSVCEGDARARGVHQRRHLRTALEQLAAYFDGSRRDFDLTLVLSGTDFELSIWSALREIPFGETRTYSQLAAAIGRPAASRAAGAANGKSPVPIVVPCHRVVGASGALVGFGGGLERKRWLLEHESGLRRLSLVP